MFFKKVMELTDDDIQDILTNLTTRCLIDEIFSRDAKVVVHHLDERYRLELLQELLKDRPLTPEIEEELLHQARRCNVTSDALKSQLDIDVMLTKILKQQSISQLLETIARLIKGYI